MDFAFLDSGIGGLPYLRCLKERRPAARCVYVADTRNFPYGAKAPGDILRCASAVTERIIRRWQPEAVVIACNTISVTALEELRRRFPETQFVGTVPAIKPAAELSKTKRIGLLATEAAAASPYIVALKEKVAPECTLVCRGDNALVSFIERRYLESTPEERGRAVLPAVRFFKDAGCDAFVLGCTHFLNMTEDFRRAAGPDMAVVDSRDGVVRRALSVGGAAAPGAGGSEASTEPALYVTGFSDGSDGSLYDEFCRKMHFSFCGIFS
ncbi:MAG: glutamate racemase [Treponemataceae bacterium]|nr:glutamate racemase [Treponemataceae bacterium]